MTHTQVFLDYSSKPHPSAAVRHNNGTTVSVGCTWGASNALTVFGTFAEVEQFVMTLKAQLDTLRQEPATEAEEVINALPY